MARIPFASAEQIPDDQPNILARIERERGSVPNIYKVMANAPRLADAFRTLALTARNDSGLDPRIRELAILAVTHSAPSEYEFAHHSPMAREMGVTAEQLDALDEFETSPAFSESERAVVRYACEATRTVKVSDATWEALITHLGSEDALAVVLQVALYNASVRITVPLQIELEPEYLKYTGRP